MNNDTVIGRVPATPRRLVALCMVLAAMLAVGACSGKKDKPVTQVAAKVNAEEISVHQVNFVLQQQRGIRPEQLDPASRSVLERLIDQELAVQKATEAGLDHDARVQQALDAARREVLARAYLERQADAVDRPTPQDIETYYADKPALFKERRIYAVEEFTVDAKPESAGKLGALLQSSKSPVAYGEALKAAGLRYASSNAVRPAEAVPLELLAKLAPLNAGQGVVVTSPAGPAKVFMLTAATPAPVALDQARPAIEQFLLNERKRAKLAAEVKALRNGAKIQYAGKFAEPAASAPVAAPLPPAAALPGNNPVVPQMPPAGAQDAAGDSNTTPAPDASAISKGIKGLK